MADWIKTCQICQRRYTLDEYRKLHAARGGLYYRDEDDSRLELRQCPCNNTLVTWVDLDGRPIPFPDAEASEGDIPPAACAGLRVHYPQDAGADSVPPVPHVESAPASSSRVLVLARTRIQGEERESVHPALLDSA